MMSTSDLSPDIVSHSGAFALHGRSQSTAGHADTGEVYRRLDRGTNSRPASAVANSTDADQELVLLIHGTFAGRAENEGDSWWQQSSPAWKELSKRLPAGARLPERGEVFHWSGDNSERARIKAGHDLLERLLQLELAGRCYHLIGHSHGGSVIWHALRLATLRQQKLAGLKSWTTVGTPFLHYRTRGAWSLANVVSVALALTLLKPAYLAFVGFFKFALAAVMGANASLDLRSDQDIGLAMAIFRAPVLKLLELVGVPLLTTDAGLRLGSYDPSSGQSLFDYMFFTWEGWSITLVILLGGYIFLILASVFLNPVLESLRIRAEKRLEWTAMETYRGRWLGLWSTNDEAINGLRATLDLSVSFVAQITPRDRILLSDYLSLLSRPYGWLLTPAFNHFLRPLLDRVVRSLVIKTAQGNNRPAAEVIAVSAFPVAESEVDAHPALPTELDARLTDRANQHARDIAPKLRDLLAEPSFVAGLERFGQALSGHELIHTSYFDHPPVLNLLALHVAWARRDTPWLQQAARNQADLWNWFCAFKRSVHETSRLDVTAQPVQRPHLIRPRRRHAAEAFPLSACPTSECKSMVSRPRTD
jgi:hypothetical protein